MIDQLTQRLQGLKVLILGFGMEGKSTYRVLKSIIDTRNLFLADLDPTAFGDLMYDEHIKPNLKYGESYLAGLDDFDLIIKTPGIQRSLLLKLVLAEKITSQTDLFFSTYHQRIIGITGTKGKSTTTTLIYKILKSHHPNVVLVGNIGKPPFDLIEKINPDTRIVFELSAHQLEDVRNSPHIAILLNVFEEHLDHYHDMAHYRKVKYRIAAFQDKNDWLIINGNDAELRSYAAKLSPSPKILFFSKDCLFKDGICLYENDKARFMLDSRESLLNFSGRRALKGEHNLENIMAAVCAARILGVPDEIITETVKSFEGLEHRLQYIGEFGGIKFYNDSIATIPEATIAAVKTLQNIDTLILGGKDRGINYNGLIDFLPATSVRNFIFIGDAGKRILTGLRPLLSREKKTFLINKFEEMADIIRRETHPGKICLLSPAASSYDQFRNFEERGLAFRKIAASISP